MFARVSQYSVDSERLQQEQGEVEEHLLPALRMQPGFSGGLLLAYTQKGKVLAVTLWESEQEMHATDEASHWFRVFGAAAVEGKVTDVETYEVYRAQLTHPEPQYPSGQGLIESVARRSLISWATRLPVPTSHEIPLGIRQ